MKLAILLLFAAIVATQADDTRDLTPEQAAFLARNRATCREKNYVSLEEEQELREGKFYSANQRQKCYIRCVSQAADLTDSKGNLIAKNIYKRLKPIIGSKKAKALGVVCNDLIGTDDCDTASVRYACYYYAKAASLI